MDWVEALGRESPEKRRELEKMTTAGTLLKKEFEAMKSEGNFDDFEYDRVAEDLFSVLLD